MAMKNATRSRKNPVTQEELRLQQDLTRKANWKRWGDLLLKHSGARCAKITVPAVPRGISFRTITRAAAPAGAKTGSAAFATAIRYLCFALALWNGGSNSERTPLRPER